MYCVTGASFLKPPVPDINRGFTLILNKTIDWQLNFWWSFDCEPPVKSLDSSSHLTIFFISLFFFSMEFFIFFSFFIFFFYFCSFSTERWDTLIPLVRSQLTETDKTDTRWLGDARYQNHVPWLCHWKEKTWYLCIYTEKHQNWKQ